jgi:transcription initiation factor TFIID subunit 12
MGQPVIAQTQTFKLEGADSTSVLSKKKLTELVRQVTGGTETLSPEVEEVS